MVWGIEAMGRKASVTVEEVFKSTDAEERKKVFNALFIRVIQKSGAAVAAGRDDSPGAPPGEQGGGLLPPVR
jgi:hypothetical protein